MIEAPDLAVDELLVRVGGRFGIDAGEAEFLPVGNDSFAWAFKLSGDVERFLKVLGRPVDPASLEVPLFLSTNGVPEVVAPIATVTGELVDPGAPFSLVLYPFVHARRAAEGGLSPEQRRDAGRLLARIHAAVPPDALARTIRRESFRPPATELARRAEELGELARGRDHDFVICHADFHAWNVLVGPDDRLLVVDWDETLLAPVERDLMFVDDSVGSLDREGSDFFTGYGHVDPDPLLIAYYRFDWAVQEVADYGRRVLLSPDAGDATRAEAAQMFRSLFEPGDVVDAAFEAGARVRT